MKQVRVLIPISLAFALCGCALFSKGEASFPRYFSPDLPQSPSKVQAKRSGLELRLGRVSAGSYIGEKIAFRESKYEVGFYDDRLWTEKPEAYVRRALTRALFEEEGLRSVVSGAAPTLDVELVSFEEVKGTTHIGLVRISFSLHDDRLVLMQQTIAVEHPIALSDKNWAANAVAEALGAALSDAVYAVSARVLSDLATVTPRRSPCSEVPPRTAGTAK